MKFLVVGLGSMGTRRIRNLKHLGVEKIIGFDVKEDRRNIARQEHNIDSVETLDNGIAMADAVIISTGPKDHLKIALACVMANKPCFMELNVIHDKIYDQVISLSKQKEILIAPSCTRRFKQSITQIKNWIDDGKIGKILTVNHQWGMNLKDWHPWEDIKDYYVGERQTGGAREMVCFELSWLPWIFGYPKKLVGLKSKQSNLHVDIDDLYEFIAVTDKNIVLNVSIDVISRPPVKLTTIIGSDGKIIFDEMKPSLTLYQNKDGHINEENFTEESILPVEGYLSTDDKYVREISAFIAALNKKITWPYTLEDDKRNLLLLLQIEKSISEGKFIDIN